VCSHTKSQQLQACKADAFQCSKYFEELLSVFPLPEYQPGDPEYVPDDPLHSVRKWFDLLVATFHKAFVAGTIIVVDETMIFWTGMGIHLTYLPRKPTPLGIMSKTICDASTRILLSWEFCEGKEVDARKQWQSLHGAGTACTLRLTQPWHGSNKIVIGDSWFGSLKCGAHLLSYGLLSILNVKTAHKAFPKQARLAALKDRGDTIWYELELQISGKKRKLSAGGHMTRHHWCLSHRAPLPCQVSRKCATAASSPMARCSAISIS
jgi:Transposase IS4